jgi:hypothetical protein
VKKPKPKEDEYRLKLTRGEDTIINAQIVPSQISLIINLAKRLLGKNDADVKKPLDKR